MRRFFVLAFILGLMGSASAVNSITPTTTLEIQTGNNTSAADSFKKQSNGNAGASNVSKVSMRKLMYPGFDGKIYVHFMPWFGPSNHMNVGYESADVQQVQKQVADMMSRGVDGAIVDWYGPDSTHHNKTTQLLRDESERMNGKFQFAISEDVGALKKCIATEGCDVTGKLINDLKYAYTEFEGSPAYMRYNGRPLVFFFGIETVEGIDLDRVKASVPGNPIYIWRNSVGFGRLYSGGAYAWVGDATSSTDMGLAYLKNFYNKSFLYPSSIAIGSMYPGFNDTLASWSKDRIVNQQCGQTWLKTFETANQYYSSSNQIFGMQVVTWNDYEEGSEIETGIENCVTVTANRTADTLYWSITGNENTIDHYTVFISTDGKNLAVLEQASTGTGSLDLKQYDLAPANYTLYVKAVGKPSIINKMSNAITYEITNQLPSARLTLSSTSGIAPVAISAGASGSDPDGTVAAISIDFGDGTVEQGASASHTYSTAGTYSVVAKVTDNDGGTSTATQTVTVVENKAPVAMVSVSPASGIAPVVVSASAAESTDADGSIKSTVINWGDGSSTASATGTHTYTAPGTYTVTVSVTDDRGASSSATATVDVAANQPPVARIAATPANGIAPVTVSASASDSTDSDGTIKSTVINWGDGTSTSAASGTHVYSSVGTYTITATVTDDRGATATAATSVTVVANQAPVAKLSVTPTSGIAPVTVSASAAASTDADGTIKSTLINWGDGTSTSAASGTHVYSSMGTYTITATVTDDRGATSAATAVVTTKANQAPIARLTVTPTSGTAPVVVTASATASTDADGTIKSTVINWGDGTSTSSATGSHTYASAGTYTITATVTDDLGASSKATATVTVTAATSYGVKVSAPTPNAITGKTVRFVASATSNMKITGMKIYVDGATKYSTPAAQFDTYLTLAVGQRNVVVKAWDAAGKIYSQSFTITVK